MPEIVVELPTLHAGQVSVWKDRGRFNAVRCGRRWGKTKLMTTLASDAAAKGKKVGVFTPENKQLHEPWEEMVWTLRDVKRRASRGEGTFRTVTGGQIDVWILTDNELAGRGREYDLVLVDEAAFTKNNQMIGIWERSINPTMLTRPKAKAWVFSTPNGIDTENFFWKICNDPDMGFKEHYAPTSTNPYVPSASLAREREKNHPLVFQQEFLAEFIDWSGVAFFSTDRMTVEGLPIEYPMHCDGVFATVDTAVKDGKEHDGTAVSYFSINRLGGPPLVLLDWDIVSMEGATLEHWLPGVFGRLEQLATEVGARNGVLGTWIEDKATGSVLLQQGRNRNWPVHPIDSKLTSAGKSERAINVSGYFYQGQFKISRHAYEKTIHYKGTTRNHWLAQVTGFRVGTKENQADDLLDTFTYGLAIALGNPEGY